MDEFLPLELILQWVLGVLPSTQVTLLFASQPKVPGIFFRTKAKADTGIESAVTINNRERPSSCRSHKGKGDPEAAVKVIPVWPS